MIGVGAFAVALAAALWPILTLKTPGRPAALARLDREAGLKHGPARALEDGLALGSDDPASPGPVGAAPAPRRGGGGEAQGRPPLPRHAVHDLYAVRGAAMVAVVASAFYAGPELGRAARRRLRLEDPRRRGPGLPGGRLDRPALYTRSPPLMIDFASGAGEHRLKAPIRSTVVIRMAGEGDATVTPGPGLAAQARRRAAGRTCGSSASPWRATRSCPCAPASPPPPACGSRRCRTGRPSSPSCSRPRRTGAAGSTSPTGRRTTTASRPRRAWWRSRPPAPGAAALVPPPQIGLAPPPTPRGSRTPRRPWTSPSTPGREPGCG
jgi:hypothetical protein